MKISSRQRIASCASLFVLVCAPAPRAHADITWPSSQLLPSFSPPAATQDLILLRGAPTTWQAEGPSLGHATGHADGDGWLCQVGIDEPGKHMLYGPYDASLPAGGNTARFRMKIDNNTANNAHQVTIDVHDSTTGIVLATQDITRQQFAVAGDWVTLSLPFTIPAMGHAIELRVYWLGGAYIKVDSVSVDRGSEDALVLFASLKGVVNATEPRIFSYEGDAFAEGPHTWLTSLSLAWVDQADPWTLITKYRSEITGLVVWDPSQPDTMNLATTIAGREKALVASPAQLGRLMAPPYNLPIVEDLRGRFASKLAVYQTLYDDIWPTLSQRVLFGLSPDAHKASVREYAGALGAAVIWLDPAVPAESAMLNAFLSSMTPGGVFMGWWPEEGAGITRASQFGIATVASDYATNLTLHSGMPRAVHVRAIPPKPVLENKIYVAFILSDGDNLQYVEHLMRKLWNDPARGQVPIGWTVSPAMLDAMPGALDFYARTSTTNDNLISGPSGFGYAYPNVWPDASLPSFVARSDDYARRSGLRVVTVWNTITGGIDADVGASFATNAPSLLGLTGQNTGGGLTVYSGSLPGFALSCNYCTGEQAMKDHIATAAARWNGSAPRFVLIQAQPWTNVSPSTFRNVRDSLDANHVVVRPDNWFQLLRQVNNLPIEPIAPVANGVYRIVHDASGLCIARAGSGSDVSTVTCANDDRQRWQITTTERGYTRITALGDSATRLGVQGGVTTSGAAIETGAADRQWQPVWESGERYHLLARHSDRCLAATADANGSPMQQQTCDGMAMQAFRFASPTLEEPMDGGVMGQDASVPVQDASVPDADTGMPLVDASAPDADASVPGIDAGHGEHGGGCSVSSRANEDRVALLFALGLAIAIAARRRRTR